jgi:hypothetical protein
VAGAVLLTGAFPAAVAIPVVGRAQAARPRSARPATVAATTRVTEFDMSATLLRSWRRGIPVLQQQESTGMILWAALISPERAMMNS